MRGRQLSRCCPLLLVLCLSAMGHAHSISGFSGNHASHLMLERIQPGYRLLRGTFGSRATDFMATQHVSLWFLFPAAMIAMGLGCLQAFEPRYGSRLTEASSAGSRGGTHHAIWFGLLATALHTAGMVALGAIALYASRYVVPEQLSPWLGLLSGLTVAALGAYSLLRRVLDTAAEHSHRPGEHAAWHLLWTGQRQPTTMEPSLGGAEAPRMKTVRLLHLLALGTLPCPAALLVLLSAMALHHVALGFFLIVAFSVGLAAGRVGFGLDVGRATPGRHRDGPLPRSWLPVLSASLVTAMGLLVAWQGLAAAHVSAALFSKENLGPVLFVSGLGLVLGMRHSTDADHVVAISTIVSKQRGIRNAALIGSVWGLGHTITIFAVGALIILAGIRIPPRIGLAMEFSVALMLILLGCMNLSGVTAWLIQRYSPAPARRSGVAAAAPEADRRVPAASGGRVKGWVDRVGLFQLVRPLVIGLVHGLAGSAAVALLVLSTIHSPVWATVYLLIFGFGTVLGMMVMTSAIAVPLTFAGGRFTEISRYFGITSGLISVCFGLFLVYQLGYVGGLFTSHPQWTPQ